MNGQPERLASILRRPVGGPPVILLHSELRDTRCQLRASSRDGITMDLNNTQGAILWLRLKSAARPDGSPMPGE